ncbi:MAG: tripartite tricarboxylate transporter permease [Proteobacteria bacterium]|nr:tripartite tricarboxylate transporter permease [Pseudomonadota bacterium]
MISIFILVVVAQNLAAIALKFGPAERTTLLLFALTIVGVLSGKSMIKGLLAGSLGLIVATVGADPMLAVPRFTFGLLELEDGFSYIPLLIGLFAVSEMFQQAEDRMGTRIRAVETASSKSKYNVGYSFMPLFKQVTEIPRRILFPIIFVFCVIGSYSIRNMVFDVFVMMAFGVIGYFMRRGMIPVAPMLIAFILAQPFEEALRQALVGSEGHLGIFFTQPIAVSFLVLTAFSIGLTMRRNLKSRNAKIRD